MSRLTAEILDQVEKDVQGSSSILEQCFDNCAEFYNYGFEYNDLTSEEELQLCEYIDNHHFQCVSCGWWCEISEIAHGDNDEMICSGCYEEEDEE